MSDLFNLWHDKGVWLLAHKYRYYVMDNPTVGDMEYDMAEKEWIEIGKKIGKTRTPPYWVGFDFKHPWASEARDKALEME